MTRMDMPPGGILIADGGVVIVNVGRLLRVQIKAKDKLTKSLRELTQRYVRLRISVVRNLVPSGNASREKTGQGNTADLGWSDNLPSESD